MSNALVALPVELGDRRYDILVGEGLIGDVARHVAPVLKRPRVVIVTDRAVADLHLARLEVSLGAAGIRHEHVVLPPGEATKEFGQLARLLDALLDFRIDRNTTLIALGGGVIGDIGGFAASIVLRGIDYIQIPTTLLAQVDSSVGGKTAVNTRHGKNLVGTFYQPRLVLADLGALATLPRRELLAGYGEVVKYGLINDPAFFDWLEGHGPALLAGDIAALGHAVLTSCRAKALIVAADERETGDRALLNLGHTFAHALEAETAYGGELLHGEAVAIGMVLAFALSVRLGLCLAADLERVRRHFHAVGLPTTLPRLGQAPHVPAPARLLARMASDKKAGDGQLTFILARGIGRSFIARDVDPGAVADLLTEAAELCK
ncbi:MAG: 3-dehydroquinate synthase [Alphaproteobacteria bacterium]|nr:3-dehydroquinate synthase [Alphaproteobacteria bacterium]